MSTKTGEYKGWAIYYSSDPRPLWTATKETEFDFFSHESEERLLYYIDRREERTGPILTSLTTFVFALNKRPDFSTLKERGWTHPVGIRDEVLENSLVKDFGEFQIQIVRHKGRWDHTEAYIHERIPFTTIQKKGEGKEMTKEAAISLISSLYDELEGVCPEKRQDPP